MINDKYIEDCTDEEIEEWLVENGMGNGFTCGVITDEKIKKYSGNKYSSISSLTAGSCSKSPTKKHQPAK